MVAPIGTCALSVANVSVKSLSHVDASVDLECLLSAPTSTGLVAGNG